MELLLPEVRSQIRQIFPKEPPKRICLCSCRSMEKVPQQVKPASKYFGLLLMADGRRIQTKSIAAAADKLVKKGLAYFCAWGPDCERIHDIFDESAFAVNEKLKGNNVIMTTWHENESLVEALWFFLHSAFPTEYFSKGCSDWVISVIGSAKWEQEVRAKIQGVAFVQPE